MSSLFLSGTELYVIMSLSKDYISWRWFLHWENYASLNWNVFRKLLCVCFLTRNAEGDLFASLIEQHLLGLEEKPFHIFSLSYPAFFMKSSTPSTFTLPVLLIFVQVDQPGTCVDVLGSAELLMHICCSVFFHCWISQTHTITEAGKHLWVQPLITTVYTHLSAV